MKLTMIHKVALALVLAIVTGSASAALVTIDRLYSSGDNGGIVRYEDLGSNQLRITFDNTTISTDFGSYENSSVITGLVFDILTDIEALDVVSFVAGDASDLTSFWDIRLDVNNNITPGNTKVDLSFKTKTGIDSGIYNSADPGSELTGVVPDKAILLLDITKPTSWVLNTEGISNDILRMQRVGDNGEYSLKLPGYNEGEVPPDAIPEPGMLALFGMGLLGMGLSSIRRKRKAS